MKLNHEYNKTLRFKLKSIKRVTLRIQVKINLIVTFDKLIVGIYLQASLFKIHILRNVIAGTALKAKGRAK